MNRIKGESSPESAGKNRPCTLISPYAETADAVFLSFGVEPLSGLSSVDAAERLKECGPNVIKQEAGRTAIAMLLGQFTSVVVWLLIAASVIAFFTDGPIEGGAILIVLVLNAGIGFAVEWQAGRALQALSRASVATARVRRDGRESVLNAAELVPGDVIILSAGDSVPADARLLEAANLQSNESTLTGESVPVSKSVQPNDTSTPLAERQSMVYVGTSITAGRGLAIVTATGANTELGGIGELLSSTEDTKTPLEVRLAQLGRWLVYVVLLIAGVVILTGYLRGDDPWLMAKVAISLAVAAVPEGLPAVTTLILALGVLRMARRSAIVRHLPAVETLGGTTVICTDKTGTLTENRMTVKEIDLADGRMVDVPDALPSSKAEEDRPDPIFTGLLRVAVVCNEAVSGGDGAEPIGDPTEMALLVLAQNSGIDIEQERAKYKKISEIPFDAASKRMTVLIRDDAGGDIALLKGAPGVVLDACSQVRLPSGAVPMDVQTRQKFHDINEEMASRAMRVLAFAEKTSANAEPLSLEDGFTFLGLAGMTDPPRANAKDSIRVAKEAGIRVVMLTGDQLLTAKAIAKELELSDDDDVFALHANDLESAESAELAAMARKVHVFARVSPEDKFRIVEALQDAGEIVAVTGDGVNDAPALKQANIGIAMGERGTDVAKEASDIVLTNDNFSTIVNAIESGRTIYANILKFVHLMFSHNLGEVMLIFIAIAAGLPLPLLPLQILWINLVTDIFPALALAVEPAGKDTMKRRPRSPKESLLSRPFMILILWQGAMLALIALGAYYWALGVYGEGEQARTVALLALVGVQLGHLFNCRSRQRSAFSGLSRNPFIFVAFGAVWGLQLLAVYFMPLSEVLGLARPSLADWGVVAACVVLPIVIVEITKLAAYLTTARDADAV